MIIAGLTDDGTKLTLSYNALDGSRGTKSNPYRLIDIYDTCVNNGWNYIDKIENQYFLNYQLDIDYSLYFKIENENLELKNGSGAMQTWYWCGNLTLTNCRISIIFGLNITGIIRMRFDNDDENIFNNVFISGLDAISNAGGKFTIYNMQWNKIENSYICYGNTDITIDNFLATDTSWGFIPQGNFTLATRLKSEKCTRGILAGYASFDLYNYTAKDNTKADLGIIINSSNRFCNFIDPNVDLNKIVLYGTNSTGQLGTNPSGYVNLKSTFKLLIDDADYVIEDNYGNQYTGNTNDVNELELIYWRYEGANFEYEIKNNYEPFRVVISKPNFETLEISNIYVTAGQPTVIRAALKPAIEALVTNKGLAIKTNKTNYGKNRDFAIIP